jgi:hypothetical protein
MGQLNYFIHHAYFVFPFKYSQTEERQAYN